MSNSHISVIAKPDKSNPFIIIDKPAGLPSAPLVTGDDSALTQAELEFPEINSVTGRKVIEKGLIHRIDTATRGLLLIAVSQNAYDNLFESQKKGLFKKWYCAKINDCRNLLCKRQGFPPLKENIESILSNYFNTPSDSQKSAALSFSLESNFRPFGVGGKTVRPVTEFSGKAALKKKGSEQLYHTDIIVEGLYATCSLTKGYRHQVRCHLAWAGIPIQGDRLYNPVCEKNDTFIFSAYKISFPHPLTGARIDFQIPCYNILTNN